MKRGIQKCFYSQWPIQKTNTLINIIPQETTAVVERLGKFHKVSKSGLFFAIPLIDKISYIIDKREQSLFISPLNAITKDNVSLKISGNLFIKFIDEIKAAYGSNNPFHNIEQFSISAMRNSIGNMQLDDILMSRNEINKTVKEALDNTSSQWGIETSRFEITDLQPDETVLESMKMQSIAERKRREQVLESTAIKECAKLVSEGELIKTQNEANALKYKIEVEAKAKAEAMQIDALAKQKYINLVSESIQSEESVMALNSILAIENIKMMSDIGQKSNTMFFSKDPSDFRQLMAMTSEILKKQ